MRLSDTLAPTLRDDPLEAEIASHKLMLRAGLMRRIGSGLYTFLPLGLRALRKLERIIREEMDRAGALEVLMPALQPRELWDTSGRYAVMGPTMFRLKDRQERDMVLGPTHEEAITHLVSHEINSYRQMPKTFYQIQTKFRDEIRPRFGLMRAKEFIMKDAYSFDVGQNEADTSYKAMYDAYVRIFTRCGLRTKIVEADTGAMGGKWSHEFMVLADSGEDGLVECGQCAYAANLERAERGAPSPAIFSKDSRPLEAVSTPGKRTIQEVSAFLKCEPERLIKTMIYIINGKPCAVLAAGDRDINEAKLARALETAEIVMADDATIQAVTGAPVGFAGPVGLKIPVYADAGLKDCKGAVTGGNKTDTHVTNIDIKRDVKVEAYFDLCTVRAGDHCPRCRGTLVEQRGIEVGHVFKLGTKYTDSFHATYLDEKGEKRPIVMGCYGIGVTRTLQAIVEQCHDDNGIIWPVSVAPYDVALLILGQSDEKSFKNALDIAAGLEKNNVEVLLDDRDERPGVKFKDADLLGLPIRAVVSERSLASNSVEVKLRTQPKPELVPLKDAVGKIRDMIGGLSSGMQVTKVFQRTEVAHD